MVLLLHIIVVAPSLNIKKNEMHANKMSPVERTWNKPRAHDWIPDYAGKTTFTINNPSPSEKNYEVRWGKSIGKYRTICHQLVLPVKQQTNETNADNEQLRDGNWFRVNMRNVTYRLRQTTPDWARRERGSICFVSCRKTKQEHSQIGRNIGNSGRKLRKEIDADRTIIQPRHRNIITQPSALLLPSTCLGKYSSRLILLTEKEI